MRSNPTATLAPGAVWAHPSPVQQQTGETVGFAVEGIEMGAIDMATVVVGKEGVSDYNPSTAYLTHNRCSVPGANVTTSSAAFALSTHTMLR